jgi:DNA-binding transcriptional ArsR family regulator
MRTPRPATGNRTRPRTIDSSRPRAAARARSRALQPATAAQFAAHSGEAAALLKVLANPHRLGVLCQLVGGELSVGELLARFELSQSALSQHLAVLRTEGLVTTRRDAQVIYYQLADGPVHEIIETLHRIYCRPAPRRARAATTRTR